MSIEVLKSEPVPDVIEICEDLLERAKAGTMIAIAVAAQSASATTTTVYSIGDGDVAHLICAIERVKLRLLDY